MSASQRSLKTKLGGLAASLAVRAWMRSIDFQSVFYDATVDFAREDFAGPLICIFWHEYLLTPLYLRGGPETAILASRHRDAEWLSEASRHLGFRIVRGSTNRGGSQALLEMMRSHGTRNLGNRLRRSAWTSPTFGTRTDLPFLTAAIAVGSLRGRV